MPQVSIIAAVDANTYRRTVFNLSNGTAVRGLGIQAAAVSLFVILKLVSSLRIRCKGHSL